MYDEEFDEYDPDMYQEYGEGFEDEFDSVSEQAYEKAFSPETVEAQDEGEFEYDEVTGSRDKKPVMSLLNKGKLSKYEMDDLLNTLDE